MINGAFFRIKLLKNILFIPYNKCILEPIYALFLQIKYVNLFFLIFQEHDADLVFDDNQHAIYSDDNSLNKNSDKIRTNLVSKRSVSDSDIELEDNQFKEEDDQHWLSRLKRSVRDLWSSDEPELEKKQKHINKKKKDMHLKVEGYTKAGKKNTKIPKKSKRTVEIIRPVRDLNK